MNWSHLYIFYQCSHLCIIFLLFYLYIFFMYPFMYTLSMYGLIQVYFIDVPIYTLFCIRYLRSLVPCRGCIANAHERNILYTLCIQYISICIYLCIYIYMLPPKWIFQPEWIKIANIKFSS